LTPLRNLCRGLVIPVGPTSVDELEAAPLHSAEPVVHSPRPALEPPLLGELEDIHNPQHYYCLRSLKISLSRGALRQ